MHHFLINIIKMPLNYEPTIYHSWDIKSYPQLKTNLGNVFMSRSHEI